MVFQSILFNETIIDIESAEQPSCFLDLNLDQLINAIIAPKKDYDLEKYFYTPLQDSNLIHYRNEVMKDLDNDSTSKIIQVFAEKMNLVKRYLKLLNELSYEKFQKSWILETALEYCDAVTNLHKNLESENLSSDGMKSFVEYLKKYTESELFHSMMNDALMIKSELAKITYSVNIDAGKVTIKKYEEQEDYSIDILRTFEKFKQGVVKDYKSKVKSEGGMDLVDAKILVAVSKLFPEPFNLLDNFCNHYKSIVDEKIRIFDREIQFYISYLNFISQFRRKNHPFCYATLVDQKDDIYCSEGIDLALAQRNIRTDVEIIPNDFTFIGQERVIVVTGPNQGGKTTFARMFGQVHYLALLGCLVSGSKAQIYLSDKILTHFEKEETVTSLQGKLKEELTRIYDIFENATPKSILVINEIFSSTTLEDATYLLKEIMQKIEALDVYCVIVTFIDEISTYSSKTVSMVSTIESIDSEIRTFKIVRRPADGLAYALSIAKKHELSYEQILERIP